MYNIKNSIFIIMSSIITKTIVSGIWGCITGSSSQLDGATTNNFKINSSVFSLTFAAMTLCDIFDFFRGNIKTIQTLNANGELVEKQYKVIEVDFMKFIANALPVAAVITEEVLQHFGVEKTNCPAVMLGVGIVLDLLRDMFNIDTTDTHAWEINGDNEIITF